MNPNCDKRSSLCRSGQTILTRQCYTKPCLFCVASSRTAEVTLPGMRRHILTAGQFKVLNLLYKWQFNKQCWGKTNVSTYLKEALSRGFTQYIMLSFLEGKYVHYNLNMFMVNNYKSSSKIQAVSGRPKAIICFVPAGLESWTFKEPKENNPTNQLKDCCNRQWWQIR